MVPGPVVPMPTLPLPKIVTRLDEKQLENWKAVSALPTAVVSVPASFLYASKRIDATVSVGSFEPRAPLNTRPISVPVSDNPAISNPPAVPDIASAIPKRLVGYHEVMP